MNATESALFQAQEAAKTLAQQAQTLRAALVDAWNDIPDELRTRAELARLYAVIQGA